MSRLAEMEALKASLVDLIAAQKKSERAAEARRQHPVGTSRARSTTLNANWARSAEHRDRLEAAFAQRASAFLGLEPRS